MTVFGHHTVTELKELIANKDFVINAIRVGRNSFNWPDIGESFDWDKDFALFLGRYIAARGLAEKKFASVLFSPNLLIPGGSPISPDVVPAEDEYQAILHALTREPGNTQKGDIGDLVQRLANAGAKLDFDGAPQPTSTDIDLDVFKTTDSAKKSIEKTAKTSLEIAKPALIIGGIALLGVAYFASKTYLPRI